MLEKGIRGEICHDFYQYVKANKKYMKNYNRSKDSSHFKQQNVKNVYGCAMSRRLPLGDFKLVKETSPFIQDFMKR